MSKKIRPRLNLLAQLPRLLRPPSSVSQLLQPPQSLWLPLLPRALQAKSQVHPPRPNLHLHRLPPPFELHVQVIESVHRKPRSSRAAPSMAGVKLRVEPRRAVRREKATHSLEAASLNANVLSLQTCLGFGFDLQSCATWNATEQDLELKLESLHPHSLFRRFFW